MESVDRATPLRVLQAAMTDLCTPSLPDRLRLSTWNPANRRQLRRLRDATGGEPPGDVDELVGFASGFSIRGTDVHLCGDRRADPGSPPLSEHVVVLCARDHDFTAVDVPAPGRWGAVLRYSPDPVGVAVEAANLTEWLRRLFDAHRAAGRAPDDGEGTYARNLGAALFPEPVDCALGTADVLLRSAAPARVAAPSPGWLKRRLFGTGTPYRRLPTAGRTIGADDPQLREFAAGLPPHAVVFDLRRAAPGDYADVAAWYPPSFGNWKQSRRDRFVAGTRYVRGGHDLLFAALFPPE